MDSFNTKGRNENESDVGASARKSDIHKKLVDTIKYSSSNQTVSVVLDVNEHGSNVSQVAYDPTQPQYSPTYDPAAMMDGYYDYAELAYDPEYPDYFSQDSNREA